MVVVAVAAVAEHVSCSGSCVRVFVFIVDGLMVWVPFPAPSRAVCGRTSCAVRRVCVRSCAPVRRCRGLCACPCFCSWPCVVTNYVSAPYIQCNSIQDVGCAKSRVGETARASESIFPRTHLSKPTAASRHASLPTTHDDFRHQRKTAETLKEPQGAHENKTWRTRCLLAQNN